MHSTPHPNDTSHQASYDRESFQRVAESDGISAAGLVSMHLHLADLAEVSGAAFESALAHLCLRGLSEDGKADLRERARAEVVRRRESRSPTPRRRRLRLVTEGDHPPLMPVAFVLPDAPVPVGAVVPSGFVLSSEGVFRRSTDEFGRPQVVCVAPLPVVVSRRFHGGGRRGWVVEVAWHEAPEWPRRVVSRTVVASVESIAKLAAYGFPVHSDNALAMVEFIARFEHANRELLSSVGDSSAPRSTKVAARAQDTSSVREEC